MLPRLRCTTAQVHGVAIIWEADPSPTLQAVFADIAASRMAGLPICNPALQVEALGFKRAEDGHWVGVMITPWAINLLRLPGQSAGWPEFGSWGKCDWRFASGDYEFMAAEEARLGGYHLCSLFSPASEFASHEQARLTALAIAAALHEAPIAASEPVLTAHAAPSRRAFLGLRG